MPLLAVLLILTSAVLHAVWNFLAKSSRDTIAYFWWSVTVGAVGYGAWLLFNGGIYLASGTYLPFAISAVAEVIYFVTLMEGYKHGDLSVVYPISRGGAPLFLLLFNAILFAERLPALGYGGIALMIAGVYLASLTANGEAGRVAREILLAPFRNRAARMALTSAFFIGVYSLSDKFAVSGANTTSPLVYNFWVYAANALLWIPLVWSRARVAGNLAEVRVNWLRVLIGSAMTIGGYVAVLFALTLTSASYVTAGRSLSVVIGALLGALALKEGFGQMRVLGALLMVAGLALIAFA